MGQVISLDERRRERSAKRAPAAEAEATAFYFDLGSPSTYFAAERADRLFGGLTWRPALMPGAALVPAGQADARARELRMPLVWPDGKPEVWRSAMRVAAYAAERGQASVFVLAACRLAYCGGFDLDDPEILAEAAAAAALPLEDCLAAAGDKSRDEEMEAAGLRLRAAGADRLPVLAVGGRVFAGEERLAEAAAAAKQPCGERRQRPFDGAAV